MLRSIRRQPVSLARWYLRGISGYAPEGPPAFVFDIDGVLIQGGTVLPEAKKALAKLYTNNGAKPKYPVCFLTNGGGVTEAQKAEQLSGWLDVAVGVDQVVLSHTPYRELAKDLGDKPVVISGRGASEVAAAYGFKRAVTTSQLSARYPKAVPFCHDPGLTPEGEAIPDMADPSCGTEEAPFQAVLVFSDPIDWYRDLQLITDVIMSGGVMGRSEPPAGGQPVPLYYSNPDIIYANEFPAPRFGQGCFAAALDAVYAAVNGHSIKQFTVFGKPHSEPYRLMEGLLLQQAKLIGLDLPSAGHKLPFGAVYAVGDNPASDIAGARAAGRPWTSILVRTGIFRRPAGENDPDHPADFVVQDVLQAVDAALHRTRHSKWHSMR